MLNDKVYYKDKNDNLYRIILFAKERNTLEDLVIFIDLSCPDTMYVEKEDIFAATKEVYTQEIKYKISHNEILPKINENKKEQIEVISKEECSKEAADENSPYAISPLLMRFLDAETYEEKLEIFESLEKIADMHMLDTIAASMDISLNNLTNLDACFLLIKDNLLTQKKFEVNRWR